MVLFPRCLQPDHAMAFRRKLVPALLGLGVAVTAAPLSALAQQGPGSASRLTPQQQEQLFPEQKQLWLKHAQARIAAMQTGQRCVQAARNAQTFRSCLMQERQSNLELRRTHMADMRALLGRYGIQMPEKPERRWGPDGAGGGWKKGGGGAGGPEV
jgi:hypothetical protein